MAKHKAGSAARPTSHQRLGRQLVVEAALEVRFQTELPYGIVPGRLLDALQDAFPTVEELPAAQIPVAVDMPSLVRHRFLSNDGERMVQVGSGMVSLNHRTYKGFDAFFSDAESVLKAATKLELFKKVTRLGLRYINLAALDRSWSEIITYKVSAPTLIESAVKSRRFHWVTDAGEAGVLQAVVSWPTQVSGHEPGLAIDLDCFLDNAGPLGVPFIQDWLNRAHEHIYQAFRSSLTEEYFSILESGEG